jgi:hypothetical protein
MIAQIEKGNLNRDPSLTVCPCVVIYMLQEEDVKRKSVMHVSEAGSREDNYTAQYTSSKTGKTIIKKVANPVVKMESDGVTLPSTVFTQQKQRGATHQCKA